MNLTEMNFGPSQSDHDTPVHHIPLGDNLNQINSSQNPSIEGNADLSKDKQGIMNRFFGVQKASIQDKTEDNNVQESLITSSQKTDPETIKAIVEELDDIMISNSDDEQVSQYMRLDN